VLQSPPAVALQPAIDQ